VTYVRTVAERYKGRIRHYEIWNEPNLTRFFSGSVQEMVTLARLAYQTLKDVDPAVSVVSPAPVGPGGIEWLDRYMGLGGARYLDIVGYHFYVIAGPPEGMIPTITAVHSVMEKYGIRDRPLWNTETGRVIASCCRPVTPGLVGFGPSTPVLDPYLAQAYVGRALVLGWANEVARFFWYAWDNAAMGLAEDDGKVAKPAGIAYSQVASWLIGATVQCSMPGDDGLWRCTVRRRPDREAMIVWDPVHSTEFALPMGWSAARLEQLTGAVRWVTPDSAIRVGADPMLIERVRGTPSGRTSLGYFFRKMLPSTP